MENTVERVQVDAAFDAAMVRRCPHLPVRPESPDDRGFLIELWCACSPLAGQLPPPLLAMQAMAQIDSHRASHSTAMFRVVTSNGQPIGRIIVDWQVGGMAHGVDIAVLPSARRTHAGLHMLRAWLEVCDVFGLNARLEVLAGNPARLIYRRLGFIDVISDAPLEPSLSMIRPAHQP